MSAISLTYKFAGHTQLAMIKYIDAFPFLHTGQYVKILRIVLGLFMMAHGFMRLYMDSLHGFGEFLDSKGFKPGHVLAWCVTIFDIAGGVLLTAGYFKKIISAGFIFELTLGIFLVHIHNGWFVVGHQSGGIEYSVLLIFCFLLIASVKTENKKS